METRQLGTSGLTVSALGLSCMGLGRKEAANQVAIVGARYPEAAERRTYL